MKSNFACSSLQLRVLILLITLSSISSAFPYNNHRRLHSSIRHVAAISSFSSESNLMYDHLRETHVSFDNLKQVISPDSSNTTGSHGATEIHPGPQATPSSTHHAKLAVWQHPHRSAHSQSRQNYYGGDAVRRDKATTLYSSQTTVNMLILPSSTVRPLAADAAGSPLKSTESSAAVAARDVTTSSTQVSEGGYGSFLLDLPSSLQSTTSSSSAPHSTSSVVCPAGNGTTYTSTAGKQYQIICDIDYPNNDYTFQITETFDQCVQKCDDINAQDDGNECLAALFVPTRANDSNDCYLKYALDDATPSKMGIDGAVLITSAGGSTSNLTIPIQSASGISVTYASSGSVIAPEVAGSTLHGPVSNQPTTQYLNVKSSADLQLSDDLLTVGVNNIISTGDLSPDTGILDLNASTQSFLADITDKPHISRDGGKGGYLNGQNLFVFCDTGSYSTTTDTTNGNFLGFVSSSVAIDVGMNGVVGKSLAIQDGIGQWSDNVGRMRGLAPLTQLEQGYNLAMQGQGQRYAVWPESSFIPLDQENAILYAPIVYDNVNEYTKATVFTYTGSTLLRITAGGKGGPSAQRLQDKLFEQGEVEWGCIGGIRSWGSSGIGGTDGNVYVFGGVQKGLLIARVDHDYVADLGSYEYWNGEVWSSTMETSSSSATFVDGAFMDVDIFYSPRHLTFIMVYMTIYADSTFYFRYLEANQPIVPPFAPGGDQSSDHVENILKYPWSEEYTLYKAANGLGGSYVYAGGVHQGYFGTDDITNGGTKMLLSWTAPTGQNPGSADSEYQIITCAITWT